MNNKSVVVVVKNIKSIEASCARVDVHSNDEPTNDLNNKQTLLFTGLAFDNSNSLGIVNYVSGLMAGLQLAGAKVSYQEIEVLV